MSACICLTGCQEHLEETDPSPPHDTQHHALRVTTEEGTRTDDDDDSPFGHLSKGREGPEPGLSFVDWLNNDSEGKDWALSQANGGRTVDSLQLERADDGFTRSPRTDSSTTFTVEVVGDREVTPTVTSEAEYAAYSPGDLDTLDPCDLDNPLFLPEGTCGEPIQVFVDEQLFESPTPTRSGKLLAADEPVGALDTGAVDQLSSEGVTVQPSGGAGAGPINGEKLDTGSDECGFLVRYACCNGIFVRSEPNPEADIIDSLLANELLLVYDLVGSNNNSAGLRTAAEDTLDTCSSSTSQICGNAVMNFANNNLPYWMEVVTEAGVTGYIPLGAAVMHFDETPAELHFQANYGLIAEQAANAIQDIFSPPDCGDAANTWTAYAGAKDVVYTNTHAPQHSADADDFDPKLTPNKISCDDALQCPDWTAYACNSDNTQDDALLENCMFTGPTECNTYDGNVHALLQAHPGRTPALGQWTCLPNSCPGKATCASCRPWFEETGQNITGWRTEEELVQDCVAEQLEEADIPDPCPHGPDLCTPIQCSGGKGPTCYDYCQFTLQTHKIYECSKYIPAGDSRLFTDHQDYECGEYPVGVTHPNRWRYYAQGNWVGDLDYDHKLAAQVPFLGRELRFEMGRLPGQSPVGSFSTFDLTHGGVVNDSLGSAVGPRNVWMSYNPRGHEADIQVCVYVPGLTVDGPDVEGLSSNTYGMLHRLDFGWAGFDHAKVCLDGVVSLEENYAPRVTWVDMDYDIEGANFGDQTVAPGPSYYAAWVATHLAKSVLGPLQGVFYAALAIVGGSVAALNVVTNHTDFPSALVEMISTIMHKSIVEATLTELNKETESMLAGIDPQVDARLDSICDTLWSPVPDSNPLFYFYTWIAQQCHKGRASLQVAPFYRDPGAEADGCYGTEKLFTPDDHHSSALRLYSGQQWWLGLPQDGCRSDTGVGFTVDETLHDTMRCATAVLNAHINTGSQGSLINKVSSTCTIVGLNALRQKYGNGWDYADLYLCKHPSGIDDVATRD